jgi:hypothetical protein
MFAGLIRRQVATHQRLVELRNTKVFCFFSSEKKDFLVFPAASIVGGLQAAHPAVMISWC